MRRRSWKSSGNFSIIARGSEAQVTIWTWGWHLNWGWSCGIEPFTSGIRCYLQVDSIKIELIAQQWWKKSLHIQNQNWVQNSKCIKYVSLEDFIDGVVITSSASSETSKQEHDKILEGSRTSWRFCWNTLEKQGQKKEGMGCRQVSCSMDISWMSTQRLLDQKN